MTRFKFHLRLHRIERTRLKQQLCTSLICACGRVRLSEDAGLFIVWKLSPKCGYSKVLSIWPDVDSAAASMRRVAMVHSRRARVTA